MNHKSENSFGAQQQRTVNVALRYFLRYGFTVLLCLTVAGCSGGGPKPVNPKAVYPVTGIVHVKGSPTRGIKIRLAPDPMPADGKITLPIIGRSNSEGKFLMTTYYQDDGAPVGEYKLMFEWDQNPSGSKRDYFQGAYSNPNDPSPYTLSVKGDETEPIDLGIMELEPESN